MSSQGSGLRGGEAGGGEEFCVDGNEEPFAAGKDGAVWALDFGLVEELAVGCAVGLVARLRWRATSTRGW